jgi:hypothetical protein
MNENQRCHVFWNMAVSLGENVPRRKQWLCLHLRVTLFNKNYCVGRLMQVIKVWQGAKRGWHNKPLFISALQSYKYPIMPLLMARVPFSFGLFHKVPLNNATTG